MKIVLAATRSAPRMRAGVFALLSRWPMSLVVACWLLNVGYWMLDVGSVADRTS